jgi:hypothetical protein
MKKLFMFIPLVILLCFTFGCKNKEVMTEREEMKVQAEIEAQNKDTIKRYNDEIWNQGNLAVADDLFATDFVNHDPNLPYIGKPSWDPLRSYPRFQGLLRRIGLPELQ